MITSTPKAPPAERTEPTPALFVHAPRPANRSSDAYGYQCRFGTDSHWALSRFEGDKSSRVTVYRGTQNAFGSLDIKIDAYGAGSADTSITLTADEMQTIACALLDAAHHIRTVPAAKFVAPGAAQGEEVPA